MDVREALVDYLLDFKHLTKGSQRLYEQHLTVFAGWCTGQGMSLSQVNYRNVQAFLEWLKVNRK